MSLTVFGFPNTRSLRAVWMLEELGLPYEYALINMQKGESQSPAFLAINPAGKVPALKTHEGVLVESLAIVNYLGGLCPDARLIPTTAYARGLYDQWTVFAIAELEQPLWTIAKNKFALPKDQRCSEIFPTAQWEFQKALRLLSQGLGDQNYILGDTFTAADILPGHTLFWGTAFNQPIKQDNLKHYLSRVGARPALAAARSREKAAMPQ
ncbi:MAG: glutathione S-transferase family protein [Hahellaceae bacterium]|nr:glutathione S-transferase family protein [Hahellaceae bacterium]